MCHLVKHLSILIKTLITWVTSLKPINVFIATGAITKTRTLVATFHKPAGGGANPYVRFGYGPLKICYHTWGKGAGSMYTDPINIIHRSQKLTKCVLNE